MTFFDPAIPLSRMAGRQTLPIMSNPLLKLPAADIVARIQSVASAAAGGPVLIQGAEPTDPVRASFLRGVQ
jgi:hypothetical protein